MCSKCGNWYRPIPLPEGAACVACVMGDHQPHVKTGAVDCHFGHDSATPSEVRMAKLVADTAKAPKSIMAALDAIKGAPAREAVVNALSQAEGVFAQTERAQMALPNILQWATVFEMPGLKGEAGSARFKSLEAIEELVANNRRPPSDLARLRLSGSMCEAMASELPGLMAEARVAIGQVRQAAQAWQEPQQSEAPLYVAEPKHRATRGRPPKELAPA